MGLPLITKSEYKAYVGINSTNTDDLIDSLIPKVSSLVKTLCKRTFIDYVDSPKVEYSEGGSNTIDLKEAPIILVSSVEYSRDYGSTYTQLTEYTDYAISKTNDNIVCIGSPGLSSEKSIFPEATNGYRVTYIAGFLQVPEDLKLALFDLVTYYIKNDSSVHSNKAPGSNTVQIEYVINTGLPAHIRRVLDQYTMNYN